MSSLTAELERCRLRLRGAVQGVGFRPFVYRLAHELGLAGYVTNDPGGVTIEVEGPPAAIAQLVRRVLTEAPPAARPELEGSTSITPAGETTFRIEPSRPTGPRTATLLPDLAICADCAREIATPTDRRYHYPFTNCTNCGPRFSIIRSLPYDRSRTTMSGFIMCSACEREYRSPLDRRFHAQPNACPACGPSLRLTDREGTDFGRSRAALLGAAQAVRDGRILALQGLGGFHLVVDARSTTAIARLRERKARWQKPLAVMVRDVAAADELVEVAPPAAALLTSPEAPILLLPRRPTAPIAAGVAPRNPLLGVMLPYTPLHLLLMAELGFPVVATSGNTTDEPICIDADDARRRLAHIADVFLTHDRPIERQVDDSVVALVGSSPQLIRRSRGYAPRPIRLARAVPTILAVGPQLKNTIALSIRDEVYLSQHIGDLETLEATRAHGRVVRDFLAMYDGQLSAIAHDLHPDYSATAWVRSLRQDESGQRDWERHLATVPLEAVQHHHAHLAACLAEHQVDDVTLGVTWDGAGYGPDGTIWGGEFLLGTAASYERVAHLRPFRLPGGDAAAREPRRVACALLWETGQLDAAAPMGLSGSGRALLERMLERRVNAPLTTSAGRLFDAVAALAGVRHETHFEGQAAMELEWATDAGAITAAHPYPLPLTTTTGGLVLDWEPLVAAVLDDLARGATASDVAARFHSGLAHAILTVARAVRVARVALTGGCFQNRLLTGSTRSLLEAAGFSVLTHHQVPPNDGGVSLGQIAVAAARLAG